MRNFANPYFSRNIAEFWRRWHISLSTWFRDYLYIPLGGSRGNLAHIIRNTLIIFIVSGFWHGANWTFLVWGSMHALFFLPLLLTKRNRAYTDVVAQDHFLPTFKEFTSMMITFISVTFSWIFFRARDIKHAFAYISGVFSKSLFSLPRFKGSHSAAGLLIIIMVFMAIEWLGRRDEFAIEKLGSKLPNVVRWSFYNILVASILVSVAIGIPQSFIYFQF